MKPSKCGYANPPVDGTRNREIMDRFGDFLREAGPAVTIEAFNAGRYRLRSPAERYRIRFLAWRMGQVPA